MGLSLPNLKKKITDLTNNASQVYDQVNPFDAGLTYKQRTPIPQQAQRSVFGQATHNAVSNVAGGLVKPVVQFANTSNLAARQIPEATKMISAQITNNPTAGFNAAQRADVNYNRFAPQNSGLFGQGTFFKSPQEAKVGDLKTVATRIGGGTLQTAATVVPFAKGAALATKGVSLTRAIPVLAAQGAAYNTAFGAGQQLVDTGKINPKQLAIQAGTGAILGPAGLVGGKILNQGAKTLPKVAVKATTALQTASKNQTLKVATQTNKIQNIPINKLTSYEGAPSRPRVDYFKKQIQAGNQPPAIIAMRDSTGKLGVEDGKHRLQAYKELGFSSIPTKVTTPRQVQLATQGGYIGIPGGKPKVNLKQTEPKISELGGIRPNNEIQTAIEQAHNAGDNAAVTDLIKQLPTADQPAMRSALGIPKPSPLNINDYVKEQTALQESARKAGMPQRLAKIGVARDELKTKLVDSFAPIEDILNKAIKKGTKVAPEHNIKYQIDRALRSDTIGAQYIKDNGLAHVIQTVPDTKTFDQYLIAKHAVDLEANGIKTGRNFTMDKQLIDALAPTYEPHAQALKTYSQNLLDTATNYGLVSKELATHLKEKYPNYVPVNRIFSENELMQLPKGMGGGKASIGRQTVVQKIKGSKRQIESPLSSLIDKSIRVVQEGERNKAAQILTSYKDLPGNPFGLTPLRTAENVKARIDLFSQAKELRPIQNKLQGLLSTRNSWANTLQQAIEKLNDQGLKTSLKNLGAKVEPDRVKTQLVTKTIAEKIKSNAPINIDALNNSYSIKQSLVNEYGRGKPGMEKLAQDALNGGWSQLLALNPKMTSNTARSIVAQIFKDPTIVPEKVFRSSQFVEKNSQTIRNTINALVNLPDRELQSIKNKTATRENNLGPILDQIDDLRTATEGIKNNRQALLDEGRLLKDAESRGKTTISALRDGIKEIYETTPEIAAAAKSLSKEQLGLIGRILSVPTRVLRLGATGLNPAFALSNVAKDTVSAFINSSHPLRASIANPPVFLDALKAALNHNSPQYGELVRQGAGGTSFDIARNAPVQNVRSIRLQRNVATKVLYTVTNPTQFFRAVENTIGRSEELNRALQYFGNKQAALKAGNSVGRAQILGADAARNNTVNFARAGDYGRVLNSALPYLNAGIQGSRTLLRNLKDRPVQTAAKLAITAFVPTATITAWNLSDPKRRAAYNDIKQYEKQGSLIIVPPNPVKDKNGKWNVIKIPVSQEIANLNDVVRSGVETAMHDGSLNLAQLLGNATGTATSLNVQSPRQFFGQVTPQAIKPGLESLVNQNLFTGNKIVPDSQKNLSPRDQIGANTSGTATALGKLLGLSPEHIDNFIRTSTGGLGQNIVNLSDQGLAKTGVIQPSQVKGKSFGASVTGRFSGAQGQSPYDLAGTKFTDLKKTLAGNAAYKNLAPADKAKALNRLQNDVITAVRQQQDAENGTGQYAQGFTGKQVELSKRQSGLLDGTTNVSDYLTTQAQKNAKKLPKTSKTSTSKISKPKVRVKRMVRIATTKSDRVTNAKTVNPQRYAISRSSGGSFSMPKIKINSSIPRIKRYSVKRRNSSRASIARGKAKVSLKKSLV